MDEQKVKANFYQVLTAFFVVLIVVILYSVFFGPAKRYADSLWPVRTTNVSAEGKAVVEPDIANFSFYSLIYWIFVFVRYNIPSCKRTIRYGIILHINMFRLW